MGTHPIFESDFDCLTEMPFLKSGLSRKEPLWHVNDQKAQKEGLRATVYFVNGDYYCGEWKNNLRDGLGVMTYKKEKTQYTGDWKKDKKHGEGILSELIDGVYKGVYSGQWRDDQRHGGGVNFYHHHQEGVYYDGSWNGGARYGAGKMFFDDKSIYQGEWKDDQQNGFGCLYFPNGDVYQGYWKEGKRHGEGEYHFQSRNHVLKGTWVEGISKCGQIYKAEDLRNSEKVDNPFKYPIPPVELVDPEKVLEEARKKFTITNESNE